MKIIDAISSAEETLADAGIESARLDAELIVAYALGTGRAELYMRREDEIDGAAQESFRAALSRRAERCPLAYITGVKEFWSIPIRVTPDVLVPRPDTETLVEEALRIAGGTDGEPRILDLCAGSGCIAAALAGELCRARFVVADLSEEALCVARENLAPAAGRVDFVRSDLFEGLAGQPPFDMIVTNPPYIRTDELAGLPPEIAEYEPMQALCAGESGLDFISRIIEDAPGFLKPGGWLLIEMGAGQAGEIIAMATATEGYDTIRTVPDLSGTDRVISIRRSPRA